MIETLRPHRTGMAHPLGGSARTPFFGEEGIRIGLGAERSLTPRLGIVIAETCLANPLLLHIHALSQTITDMAGIACRTFGYAVPQTPR